MSIKRERSLEVSFQDLNCEVPKDLRNLEGTPLGKILEKAGYKYGQPLTCTVEPKNLCYIFEWEE
ncbi:MAG: hypothetical protein GX091_08725 [Peptococcaceae bacterium]|nr:hypothetical protein [Peptococcaceae bacterium]